MNTGRYCKIVIAISFFTLVACSKKYFCIEPEPNTLLCKFKTTNTSNHTVDTSFNGVHVLDLDTNVYYKSKNDNVNFFSTHPNLYKENHRLEIYIDNNPALKDTIEILYHSELEFISNGCGFRYISIIDEVKNTQHLFTSVKINYSLINSETKQTHLEIIY